MNLKISYNIIILTLIKKIILINFRKKQNETNYSKLSSKLFNQTQKKKIIKQINR